MADAYLEGLLVERAGKAGDAEALAAIDAEIERVGGTPPGAKAPRPGTSPRS